MIIMYSVTGDLATGVAAATARRDDKRLQRKEEASNLKVSELADLLDKLLPRGNPEEELWEPCLQPLYNWTRYNGR